MSDTNAWVDVLGLNTNPETAAEWEARLAKIAPNEKYVAASGKLKKVAEKNGWEKDNKLTKKNNRTVYRDPETGKIYAFDTQHGRFEVLDKNGNHIDEVDIDGKDEREIERRFLKRYGRKLPKDKIDNVEDISKMMDLYVELLKEKIENAKRNRKYDVSNEEMELEKIKGKWTSRELEEYIKEINKVMRMK